MGRMERIACFRCLISGLKATCAGCQILASSRRHGRVGSTHAHPCHCPGLSGSPDGEDLWGGEEEQGLPPPKAFQCGLCLVSPFPASLARLGSGILGPLGHDCWFLGSSSPSVAVLVRWSVSWSSQNDHPAGDKPNVLFSSSTGFNNKDKNGATLLKSMSSVSSPPPQLVLHVRTSDRRHEQSPHCGSAQESVDARIRKPTGADWQTRRSSGLSRGTPPTASKFKGVVPSRQCK